MTIWSRIAAIGLGTYLLRVSMFLLVGERELPGWARRSLDLVGPAAIAALVATMVLVRDGAVVAPLAPTLAVVIGFLVVRRTGNVMHAVPRGPAHLLAAEPRRPVAAPCGAHRLPRRPPGADRPLRESTNTDRPRRGPTTGDPA